MIERFHNIMVASDMKEFYGAYFLLWVFSLLYIVFHRKKMKALFIQVTVPSVMVMLVIFNPLCAVIIDKCLQGSYWRVYWIFSVYIVIAYVCTDIVSKVCVKKNKVCVTIFLIFIILICGSDIYTTKNFKNADNVYKIPERVIEVCEVLQQNGITENVALDLDLVVWVRQYDATINPIYGRDLSGGVGWGLAHNDMYTFYTFLEEECEYVVLAKSRDMVQEMTNKGYQKCAETEYYDVWKVR